jgi:hypothetical protein
VGGKESTGHGTRTGLASGLEKAHFSGTCNLVGGDLPTRVGTLLGVPGLKFMKSLWIL